MKFSENISFKLAVLEKKYSSHVLKSKLSRISYKTSLKKHGLDAS